MRKKSPHFIGHLGIVKKDIPKLQQEMEFSKENEN